MSRITANQVSCVIPHAGTAKYLREAVASAVRQKFFEVVIVNDGCPKEQLDVIADLPDIRIIHLNGSIGSANARNLGIKACNTPYVVLLDHDDVLREDYFEAMSEWMNTHHLRCASATLKYIGNNSKHVGVTVGRGADFSLPSGFLSEISLIAEVGFFPDSISEDALFFQAVRRVTQLTTCPRAGVLYRIHPQSGGSQNAKSWWAFGKLLPLYYQGTFSLAEINTIARQFGNTGIIPAGLESLLNGVSYATVRLLSRSAYACWLNREFVDAALYGASLLRHLPELGRLARRKWMPGINISPKEGGER